jgi:hypothetical protein
MFYIVHNTDNLTIIDCCIPADREEEILDELKYEDDNKGCTRFISTHPDEDHLAGLKLLDENLGLANVYCAANAATKEDESEDFIHYCQRRDDGKAFHIYRNCSRKWMNDSDDKRGSAGVNIVWPVTDNEHYKEALQEAKDGRSPNNISAVIRYNVKDSGTACGWATWRPILWKISLTRSRGQERAFSSLRTTAAIAAGCLIPCWTKSIRGSSS